MPAGAGYLGAFGEAAPAARATVLPNPIHDSLRAVRERMLAARRRAGRQLETIELVAVTKYAPDAVCAQLSALGQVDLGESRAQAFVPRAEACARRGLSLRWHFIGRLQRNKARQVVRAADVIHSIDSDRLLAAVGRVALEEGRRPEVYVEVDFTGTEARAGYREADVPAAVERALEQDGVRLRGLMTLAPAPDPSASAPLEGARRVFERMAALRERLLATAPRLRLSMGMSSDFELAIELGSDLVRVGSLLVGERAAATAEAPA